MSSLRTVLVLLFDDVEVLDFAGPFEVFSVAGRHEGRRLFNVHCAAPRRPVRARGGLTVEPDFLLDEAPHSEILVVPGGQGTRRELHNQGLIDWIGDYARRAEIVCSVCTGAILLAKAGLLQGATATTHRSAFEELQRVAPSATLAPERRYVDNGRIITSGGISAGIDMALYVVARLYGSSVAASTAEHMEYDWQPA